jgi:hypothetical protein
MAGETAAFLEDDALRALLSDVSVTRGRSALSGDYPEEIFRANGLYHRIIRGSAFGVPFAIRDGAVCVPNGDSTPRCRRIRPNGDGTYIFVDTADGTSTVMTVTPLGGARRAMTGEPAAPLRDDELHALLVDAIVTEHQGGYDGPFEQFLPNGAYQRGSGWGMTFEGRFEIRGGAVCVSGEASASRCRRIRPNPDGTYTFIDTADGSAAVMTVTRRR